MKYLNFSSSGSNVESVTWKLTKNRNPLQVSFKEFRYKCKTEILKNAFWQLLLGSTLFWKFSIMAASQRQLQRDIFILEILSYKYLTFRTVTVTSWWRGRNFYEFFLSKGVREKGNHTEIALNIIQKQYFSSSKPFFFYHSRRATPWISNQLFWKFSFLRVLWDIKKFYQWSYLK